MGMDNNASLYRPDQHDPSTAPVLCVLCRRPNPNPRSSACPTCLPPDEGEVRARATIETLRDEVRMLHAACEGHVRVRNDLGERVAELERALRYAAGCATLEMVRDTARGMGGIE